MTKMATSISQLSGEERAFADALATMVDQHGPLTGDTLWLGYKSADDNEDAEIGVNCANCVFYVSPTGCRILARQVEADARCRMAVIPPGEVDGVEMSLRRFRAAK